MKESKTKCTHIIFNTVTFVSLLAFGNLVFRYREKAVEGLIQFNFLTPLV